MSTAPVPPVAVPPAAAPPVLTAWPRSAQLTTAFLLGVAATLLAIHCFGRGSRPSDLERSGQAYRIDLNRAERAELLQLPGVGVSLAERVEDYRRRHGGFRNVDELKEVRGVGPATLDRLRPWIYVHADDSGEAEDDAPANAMGVDRKSAPARKTSKEASLKEPIDVNQATAADLQRLPGIGPKMAQRILDERRKKPFQKVEELRRVFGIGPKTLERLRPYVVVKTDAGKLVAAD